MALALYWISTIVFFGSALWIVFHAWSNDRILWAIGSFFCGIAAIIYGFMNWDDLKIPTIVLCVGILLNITSRILLAN